MNENRYQQCGEQNWFLILVAFESQINFSCKLCSGELFKKVYERIFTIMKWPNDQSVKANCGLNQNNNHVTVLVDVSYASENFNNVKNFIRDKRCPLYFKLKEYIFNFDKMIISH